MKKNMRQIVADIVKQANAAGIFEIESYVDVCDNVAGVSDDLNEYALRYGASWDNRAVRDAADRLCAAIEKAMAPKVGE